MGGWGGGGRRSKNSQNPFPHPKWQRSRATPIQNIPQKEKRDKGTQRSPKPECVPNKKGHPCLLRGEGSKALKEDHCREMEVVEAEGVEAALGRGHWGWGVGLVTGEEGALGRWGRGCLRRWRGRGLEVVVEVVEAASGPQGEARPGHRETMNSGGPGPSPLPSHRSQPCLWPCKHWPSWMHGSGGLGRSHAGTLRWEGDPPGGGWEAWSALLPSSLSQPSSADPHPLT